jgi:hypothetical protein
MNDGNRLIPASGLSEAGWTGKGKLKHEWSVVGVS